MENNSIRHMVIFTLKHVLGSEQAEQFLQDGRRILTTIPVVKNFCVFRQTSPKNEYDYGFSMEFASAAEYTAYNEHPAHVRFVAERWDTEVERFLEIDFTEYT